MALSIGSGSISRDVVATELHHIAGLTSGNSITLRPGTYHFGVTGRLSDEFASHHAESLPFTLTMVSDGRVEFSAPANPASGESDVFSTPTVRIDGQPATWVRDVRGALIDAGPSRFFVDGAPIVHAPPDKIAVPDPTAGDGPDLPVWRGCGPRSIDGPSGDPFLAELQRRVIEARRAHLAERWYPHNALGHSQFVASRMVDDPLFATVAIAAGDVSWRPRFDRPALVSRAAAAAIQPLHNLASAPLTADLRAGSLGIVGRREQRLAAARNVILSLAASSPADALTIAVVADPDQAGDWLWADDLPHARGWGTGGPTVLIIDGVDQLDSLDLPDLLAATGGLGAVIVTDDPGALPLCATAMFIEERSMAAVVDHSTGHISLGASPIGVSIDVATARANELANLEVATSSW